MNIFSGGRSVIWSAVSRGVACGRVGRGSPRISIGSGRGTRICWCTRGFGSVSRGFGATAERIAICGARSWVPGRGSLPRGMRLVRRKTESQ